MKKKFSIGVDKIKISDINEILDNNFEFFLADETLKKMQESFDFLKSKIDSGEVVYGITTQFGNQVSVLDSNFKSGNNSEYYNSIIQRQINLIMSHDCSVGDPLPDRITKLAILLRSHALSLGYSGVSVKTVEHLKVLFDKNCIPVVRRYGSIGASGDLIPLAAIASTLIGTHDEVSTDKGIISSVDMLKNINMEVLEIRMREGLALINGTSYLTAIAANAHYNFEKVFSSILSSFALILESLEANDSPFRPLVHDLKYHEGSKKIASFFMNYWKDSKYIFTGSINKSNLDNAALQNYYSLRSIPQGLGTVIDSMQTATRYIENEMNSANDNPIISLESNKILHNANFMGFYVTEASELMCNSVSLLSTWIHALLAVVVHPGKNNHLPTNLIEDFSINSGFRPLQILSASITVQNRSLNQNFYNFMVPTEGDNQDVSSLGFHAAMNYFESVSNLAQLASIIALASAQAADLKGIDKLSSSGREHYNFIRKFSKKIESDRIPSSDINRLRQGILSKTWKI